METVLDEDSEMEWVWETGQARDKGLVSGVALVAGFCPTARVMCTPVQNLKRKS